MPPLTTNALYHWDFTLDASKADRDKLIQTLKASAKKWVFQKEKGEETGYIHWQGRLSLITKTNQPHTSALLKKNGFPKETHWSPTSNNTTNDFDYCMKQDNTYLEGPWMDTDTQEQYIPRQIREITQLKPWQQMIIDDSKVWNTRTINIIYDTQGNHGKTTLKTYIGVHKIGRSIPFTNDYRDIMRMVMDTDKMPLYIIDIPRALKKDQLFQFFSGIETLKDGYAYDDRYHFKEAYFDCPNIWIFMNKLPETDYLSSDRWKIWSFTDDGNLENIDLEPTPGAIGLGATL